MKKMMKRMVFTLLFVSMTVAQLDAGCGLGWLWGCCGHGKYRLSNEEIALLDAQRRKEEEKNAVMFISGIVSYSCVLCIGKCIALLKGEGMFDSKSTLALASALVSAPALGVCLYGSHKQKKTNQENESYWQLAGGSAAAAALVPIGVHIIEG